MVHDTNPKPLHTRADSTRSAAAASARPALVKSETLFDGAAELLIDHLGVIYRLRRTALGKLILTK